MPDDLSAPNNADYDRILSMVGCRRDDDVPPHQYNPGDYGHFEGVAWYAMTPDVRAPTVWSLDARGALNGHSVTEHGDGTITVSPSIGSKNWHGWLERGVWRSVDA